MSLLKDMSRHASEKGLINFISKSRLIVVSESETRFFETNRNNNVKNQLNAKKNICVTVYNLEDFKTALRLFNFI